MKTLPLAVLFLFVLGCDGDKTAPSVAKPTSAGGAPLVEGQVPDPNLVRDQEEYVADVMAFTKTTHDQVRERMKKGSAPLKDEWNAWEKQGPMTDERTTQFYKQTTNYIYELAEWHLFVPGKRQSDLALVEEMRRHKPKNILDFGGGTGLVAILLARAGFDVTLADLDSTTLTFAKFRAERHGDKLKYWKSDVEPMPPDQKYDVILALDVLEHLPKDILRDVVDKLIQLKHPGTSIVISAPFGKTAVHPMHLDATPETIHQVERLQKELPKY